MELDIRKAKLSSKVKWAAGLLAALVVSPIIFLVIKGIVGLAIAAVLGLAVINLAPVASMKFANWKLRALKSEARTNPIETKEAQLLAARERINEQAHILKGVMSEVAGFAEMVKDMPPEERADFDPQVLKQQKLVEFRQQKLKDAKLKADAFEAGLERARRRWAVAQKLLALQKVNGSEADQQLERILNEEANEAISSSMREAMADMDLAFVMEAPAPAALAAPSSTPFTIDVQAVEVRERLHA